MIHPVDPSREVFLPPFQQAFSRSPLLYYKTEALAAPGTCEQNRPMDTQRHDPEEIYKWYEECLGISSDEVNAYDTSHISPSETPIARHFQVTNLEDLLVKLAARGVEIESHIEENSHGLFAWVYDPEGNKIELWEPHAEQKDSLVRIPEAD